MHKGGESLRKVALLFMVLCIMMCLCASQASAALVLEMNVQGEPRGIEEITINVCENFTLDLLLTEVPAVGLGSWTHDIVLDPLVEIVSVDYAAMWAANAAPDDPTTTDLLEMGSFSFAASSPGEVSLASITFHCIATGVTTLAQAWHSPFQDNFLAGDWMSTFDDQITLKPLRIVVNQVPVPGAFILLMSGLLGIVGIKKRKFFS
jgi:hypothetical protein